MRLLTTLLAACLLMLTACGGGSDAPSGSGDPGDVATPSVTPPDAGSITEQPAECAADIAFLRTMSDLATQAASGDLTQDAVDQAFSEESLSGLSDGFATSAANAKPAFDQLVQADLATRAQGAMDLLDTVSTLSDEVQASCSPN
ncbi:hypothetical protein GCM10027425_05420 [Alteromonas gracilis]